MNLVSFICKNGQYKVFTWHHHNPLCFLLCKTDCGREVVYICFYYFPYHSSPNLPEVPLTHNRKPVLVSLLNVSKELLPLLRDWPYLLHKRESEPSMRCNLSRVANTSTTMKLLLLLVMIMPWPILRSKILFCNILYHLIHDIFI